MYSVTFSWRFFTEFDAVKETHMLIFVAVSEFAGRQLAINSYMLVQVWHKHLS